MNAFRRVLSIYGRVHPSMYPLMTWRLNKETAEAVADAAGVHFDDWEKCTTLLGIPVEFIDGDEILLVIKA